MNDLKIAILQADLKWEDKDANMSTFINMFDKLTTTPDLVLLPEVFNTGFSMNPERLAEDADGKVVTWLKNTAIKYQCVVAGTLLYKEKSAFVNRMIWAFPDGETGFYDKRHLFSPGGEAAYIQNGSERKIFSIKNWKILPLTCYDLRFPVWSMNSYNDGRYEFDLIFYLANWPTARTYHWETLLSARAIENQAYVAAANRIGTDGNNVDHNGNSMIFDPFGNLLAGGIKDAEAVVEHTLDYEYQERYRSKFFIAPDWSLSYKELKR